LNVFSKFINDFLVGTIENIVGSIRLVGSNKVGVKGSLHRLDSFEVVLELFNKSRLENMSSLTGIVDTVAANIPTGNFHINGFDHG